jgi:hypothetical protein
MAKNGPMFGVAAATIDAPSAGLKTLNLTRAKRWSTRSQKSTHQRGPNRCCGKAWEMKNEGRRGLHRRCRPKGTALHGSCSVLGEVNFGFGFYDEEGVGVGVAGVAEFLAGFVEGLGHDGEEDFAFCAADEIEAALLLNEL